MHRVHSCGAEIGCFVSVMQDAAFALVEGPPAQEGDVDWEEAAAAGGVDGQNGGEDLDEEEEDGGLQAYAAGAATVDQVPSSQ